MRIIQSMLVACGLIALSASTAGATLIYYESFSANIGADTGFPLDGWNLHGGTSGAVVTAASGSPRGAIANSVGIGDNRTFDVNAGVSHAINNTQQQRAFIDFNSNVPIILWTSEYAIDTSAYSVTNIRWWKRNDAGKTERAAVQIAGNWYVSSDSTAPNTPSSTITVGDGTWTQVGVDFSTTLWLPITFTPTTALTQTPSGTPIALPAGNITAFGVYYPGSTAGLTRADGFSINATAVPEPASACLALLGMTCILAAFARRATRKRKSVC